VTKGSKTDGPPDDSVSIEIEISEELAGDAESPDETPLPPAVPFHVAEPTTASVRRRIVDPDLPVSEGADTRPGGEDGLLPGVSGIANAARRISASLGVFLDDDPAAASETMRLPRLSTDRDVDDADDDALTPPPRMITTPIQRFDDDLDDEALLTPHAIERPVAPPVDEDEPEEPNRRTASQAVLAGRFFAPLPPERRGPVLDRFSKRTVAAGTIVIRQGEANHPLVLVSYGRLEVRAELATGSMIQTAVLGPGEFFGEAALLARTPANAHVVAVTSAELLLLSPRDLYELAGAFPALWAELKDIAERRTREHERRVKKR